MDALPSCFCTLELTGDIEFLHNACRTRQREGEHAATKNDLFTWI